MRFTTLTCLLLLSAAATAQHFKVSGKVFDNNTREPLPFVNIVINNSNRGGTSDMDGRFSLVSSVPVDSLIFSYVGYGRHTCYLQDKSVGLRVMMERREVLLPEYVVMPEENPAHRIIRNAVANRDVNNPEKLKAFSYISYDKMIFTLEPDSLPALDSLVTDSAGGLRKFLDDQHIFLMETVSERRYKAPGNNKENVIASRISGLQDPIFVFLLSQMQKASFYEEIITISDKNYINPISRGSTRKYYFQLQDTLYSGLSDTTFVISFRPLLNTNFDGLQGLISINTNRWAIQNIIAEPSRKEGGISMRFRQLYEWIDDKHWFPVQLTTEIILNSIAISDSTITMSAGGSSPGRSLTFGIGKSYIRDISFDPEFKRGDFGHVEVEVDPNANHRSEELWSRYRIDSLNRKERNTYRVIDSIGEEINLDRRMHAFESLFSGKIPWGKWYLDIHRFLRYNEYEGFAPGLGLMTGERISRVFSAGGYARYGFRDDEVKFGGNMSVVIDRSLELEATVSAFRDLEEFGGTSFFNTKNNPFDLAGFRDFLITRMDKTVRYTGEIACRVLDYFKMYGGLSVAVKEPSDEYRYMLPAERFNIYLDRYNLTTAFLGFRFAYREKFLVTTRRKISLGTKYPVLLFKYSRGIEGFLHGDLGFSRYDLKLSTSFNHKYAGRTNLVVTAGYIDSGLPAGELYSGRASYRPFTLFAPESFATMRMDEFVSDRHVALFITHNFRKLLFRGEQFQPEPVLAFHATFGSLSRKLQPIHNTCATMEKGYYEAGVLVNNLIDIKLFSLGLGGFYRFGPYAFPKAGDNTAVKMTLTFPY